MLWSDDLSGQSFFIAVFRAKPPEGGIHCCEVENAAKMKEKCCFKQKNSICI